MFVRKLKSISLAILLSVICFSSYAQTSSLTPVWTQKNTTAGISGGRGWTRIFYDSTNAKVGIMGGSGGTYENDIWQYETATDIWTKLESNKDCTTISTGAVFSPMTQRDELNPFYDPINKLYWAFGGTGWHCLTGAQKHTAQAGTTTSQIVDTTLSASINYKDWVAFDTTSGYAAYVSAYNAASKTLTLLFPLATMAPGKQFTIYPQYSGGTWNYDPVTKAWTSFDGPHWGYTGQKPSNRSSAAVAYSPKEKGMYMYGGRSGDIYPRDLWILDFTSKKWINLMPDIYGLDANPNYPPGMAQLQSSMAYDEVNDVLVLFGGSCGGNQYGCGNQQILNTTWTYRRSTNAWTRTFPTVSPPPRMQHVMEYDPDNKVILMYGGWDGSKGLNDMWTYDVLANTWTQLQQSGLQPPNRFLSQFTYDRGQKAFVLYSGNQSTPSGIVAQTDVWQLRLSGNSSGNQPPIAVMSINPATGDNSTTFGFDGSGSYDPDGSITSYTWNFGDGGIATGSVTTHKYASPGTYSVFLQVIDNSNAAKSTSKSLTVSSALPPPPQLSFSSGVVSGSVSGSYTSVTVNGQPVTVTNGGFQFTAPIGSNMVIQANGSGGSVSKTVTVTAQ